MVQRNGLVISSRCVVSGDAPAAPSNLAGSGIDSAHITGTYTPSATSGATHKLGYSSDGGATYTEVTVTGGTYSIAGLVARTFYFLRLRATNVWGGSAYAGPIGVDTPDTPPSLYPANDFTDARNSAYVGACI